MEQRSQTNTNKKDKERLPREIVLALADEEDAILAEFLKKSQSIKESTDGKDNITEKIKLARDLLEALENNKVRHKKIIYLLLHPEAFPAGKSQKEVSEMLNDENFLREALIDSNPEMGSR